jgi:hypothetical protein
MGREAPLAYQHEPGNGLCYPVPAPSLRAPLPLAAKGEKRAAIWDLKPLTSRVFSATAGIAERPKANFLPAVRVRRRPPHLSQFGKLKTV